MPNEKKNSTPDLTSRRRFLTSFALGASAAPFLAASRGLFATEAAPDAASLCFSNKRVLTANDFAYLGALRIPAAGTDMMFSQGCLTGRRVDGQIRLIMIGSRTANDPVYEFADPGTYGPTVAQAPRMTMVRDWGNIYGSVRRSWHPDGAPRDLESYRFMGGLHYNSNTSLLYWTYFDVYNVARIEDWCLGATRLDDAGPVAHGPWRPSGGERKGPWRCVHVTNHPITGEMLCGSRLMSGNIGSPWGPDLWAGSFPIASTPAAYGSPDIPVQKQITYYPMAGAINADGSFVGPLRAFRRPGDYFFEPIVGPATLANIDPQKNGGVGAWTELDGISDAAWIDLPDAHGVVFTGRLSAGHIWYRNTGLGNGNCTHGFPSPVDVTGPVSTDGYPVLIGYDPADLDAVRAGSRVDYTIEPSFIINAQSRFGVATASISEVGTAKSFGGCYFDAPTRKLYVAAPMADPTIPGLLNPVVHVFRIAGGA